MFVSLGTLLTAHPGSWRQESTGECKIYRSVCYYCIAKKYMYTCIHVVYVAVRATNHVTELWFIGVAPITIRAQPFSKQSIKCIHYLSSLFNVQFFNCAKHLSVEINLANPVHWTRSYFCERWTYQFTNDVWTPLMFYDPVLPHAAWRLHRHGPARLVLVVKTHRLLGASWSLYTHTHSPGSPLTHTATHTRTPDCVQWAPCWSFLCPPADLHSL